MKQKKLATIALVAAMAIGTLGFSVPAKASEAPTTTTTDYVLTIPSTLTVANSGWNNAGGISATGSLASGKKLTVTASSENSFKLKSGNNEVGYKLATASADTEATTSWTFDSLSSTATKKDMGIIVEDYSSKPAGTYQDTVTFTAKVEDAAPATITVTINQSDWGSGWESITKDGVTVSASMIDPWDGNLVDGGTFSTTLGNFTKIVVTTTYSNVSGTGWSGGDSSKTWEGTPASTVSFSGDFWGMGLTQTTIVCTIVPTN